MLKISTRIHRIQPNNKSIERIILYSYIYNVIIIIMNNNREKKTIYATNVLKM